MSKFRFLGLDFLLQTLLCFDYLFDWVDWALVPNYPSSYQSLLAATAGVLVGDRAFFVKHEFIRFKGRYALDFHKWVDFQCSFANKNCLSGP